MIQTTSCTAASHTTSTVQLLVSNYGKCRHQQDSLLQTEHSSPFSAASRRSLDALTVIHIPMSGIDNLCTFIIILGRQLYISNRSRFSIEYEK